MKTPWRRATPDTPRCSGAMSENHNSLDERVYRIGIGRDATLCSGCADVAARLGVIDRREVDRVPR